MSWEGPDGLRPLLVHVNEIGVHPDNPRRGNLDKIEESLRAHGQLKAVVVNTAPWRVELSSRPTIVAGNHTYLAIRDRLHWDQIAALPAEMTPTKERQYLLADNHTSDDAEYEQAELGRLLKELADGGALEGSAYSDEEAAKVMAELEKAVASAPPDYDLDASPTRPRSRLVGHQPGREFRVTLDIDRAGRFEEYVRMLRKEWGKNLHQDDVVYRAVEEAVKRL